MFKNYLKNDGNFFVVGLKNLCFRNSCAGGKFCNLKHYLTTAKSETVKGESVTIREAMVIPLNK